MKRKRKPTPSPIPAAENAQALLKRFESLLSPAEFARLAEEINHPLLPTIRLNPLKMDTSTLGEMQERYHWQIQPLEFCGDGYRVDDSAGTPVSQTAEHHLGYYYIQEAASMLPAELFDINPVAPGLTLDLAASPGGKTTHLVSRTRDHGFILANDSSSGRIPALRIVLQNWGAVNTAISQFPGERLGQWFPETFDRALIDAPCSMQGLRTADSHSSRPVTEKESGSLARRQQSLLISALQAVKVGGQIVYSTCTLLPEEDEGVIDAILHQYGNCFRLVDVSSRLPTPLPGLTSAEGEIYSPDLSRSLRLWPHRLHTAGFFACLIEKTAALPPLSSPAPSRSLEQVGFHVATAAEEKKILQSFINQFGVDLTFTLEEYHLRLVQRTEKLFVFPSAVVEEFASLPLQSAGLSLAESTPEGWLPSHEWVSRFGRLFSQNRIQLTPEQTAQWMRGEDLSGFDPAGHQKGDILIVENAQGLILGRGRVLKDRLKNLLPRRII